MSSEDDRAKWSRVTRKQRDCLDLVLLRRSSKEIARQLNISKWTVDQRLAAARIALDAPDRWRAAEEYDRLRRIYDPVAYDPVQVPPQPRFVPSDFPDGDPAAVMMLSDYAAPGIAIHDGSMEKISPFREGWRHDYPISKRLMIMAAILVALVIIALLGLSIAETLTRLVSR